MGYDVHITRAENWFDEDAATIDIDEWLAFVDADAEMRLDGVAEVTNTAGETLRMEDESLAVWVGYSGHQEHGNKAWMRHADGNIVVKNPDDEILAKMCGIAAALGARVQGDEGELYGQPTAPPPTSSAPRSPARRPWWKFW